MAFRQNSRRVVISSVVSEVRLVRECHLGGVGVQLK